MTQPNPFAAAILVAIVLAIPAAARAQNTSAVSDADDEATALAALPLESPAIAEMAARGRTNAAPRDVPREIREARLMRQRREAAQDQIAFFQQMSSDRKHDLTVMLKNHKRITGRVSSADATGLAIRARYSKQESTIRYDDISCWNQVPTAGVQALQTTALILIAIPLLPFFFLGALAGWQC
jgi:hypothetical protein